MIKLNRGQVGNIATGVTKDIVVDAVTKSDIKDIIAGGSLLLLGITYLTVAAFRSGMKKFEEAELRALSDCGVIDM